MSTPSSPAPHRPRATPLGPPPRRPVVDTAFGPMFAFLADLHDSRERQPVDLAVDLAAEVRGRPEHAAFVDPNAVLSNSDRRLFHPAMMMMAGSWPAPDWVVGQSSHKKWVNPRHVHSYVYADAAVECECGSTVRLKKSSSRHDSDGADHGDGCSPADRERAAERLEARRVDRARELLVCGAPAWVAARRAGRRGGTVSWSCGVVGNRIGFDGRRAADLYEEARLNTAEALIWSHEPEKVGEAFGLSAEVLRRHVRRGTGTSPMDAHRWRLAGGGPAITRSAASLDAYDETEPAEVYYHERQQG